MRIYYIDKLSIEYSSDGLQSWYGRGYRKGFQYETVIRGLVS